MVSQGKFDKGTHEASGDFDMLNLLPPVQNPIKGREHA